jgi:DNA-binding CsgD family transcriptional regulator
VSRSRGRRGLLGRGGECDTLSGLVAAARAGRGQVVVLLGEAGIGKSALLDFVVEHAAGCRIARATGVESELELAFAGLHQLCAPHLDRLDTLPGPQHQALAVAFGLRPGPAPDRFLVGLAALTLLSALADDRPLVCVVDDAHWLDHASAQTLEFVARRLAAEPVAMVFASRGSGAGGPLAGLPRLAVRGLNIDDSAALLDSAVPGTLDPRVRDRILAESRGNPLALLELPRELSAAELAFGGAADAGTTPLAHRLERGFMLQVAPLPERSRRLLLVAAAEPVGDSSLLWRAAERLGIPTDAAAPAEAAGLIDVRDGDRVRFRHPLVRSALYRSAGPGERRQVHLALAEVTDPDADPDRRAWHRARAAVGPDEAVAAELERSAGRAASHGGLAAAAAFREQAAILTPDPGRRVRRSLAGAQAKVHAGAFADASVLLAVAEAGPIDEAGRARIDVLRAQISFAANRGNEALPLLLAAARRLESLDARGARDTYLDALSAALFAGRLASGPGAREVAEAVRAAPRSDPPRKADALLDALAVLFTDGYAAAVPLADRAVRSFMSEDLDIDEGLRFSWLAAATAASLWDDGCWNALTRRHLDVARSAGALSVLPLALTTRAVVHVFTGDLAAAAVLVAEIRSLAEVSDEVAVLAPYGEVALAAVRGREDRAEPLIRETLDALTARGEGVGVNMMQWARAVLFNGVGRYGEARDAAAAAAADPRELGPPKWALAELVEAGVRSGDTRTAAAAADQLTALAQASGTDWALGTSAGRRALLLDGHVADDLYREAIERLARTSLHLELARTRLLYGEWLRREGQRTAARAELRTAYETLSTMGAGAFTDRARHELLATGETVRKRTVEASTLLTAQEAHIARLAAEGRTNPEIGAALYISPRTVEWHLRKVFTKLGIGTRRQLRLALAAADRVAASI